MPKRAYYIHEGALPISIGYCHSEGQFKVEMKHLKIDESYEWIEQGKGGMAHLFKNENGHRIGIICIDTKDKKTIGSLVGILAHEAVHILQFALVAMGEERCGDEFAAYLVQYVTQQGFLYFNKKQKLTK